MYQRALQGMEKAWGPDHTSTWTRSTTWAASTRTRASWTRPRRCTSGHCKEREKAWGQDHTSTLDTVNNLGVSTRIPGQAGRGREDVPAGTARKGEGMGPRSHINSEHGQQLGQSLRTRASWTRPRRCTSGHCKGYEKALGPDHTSTLDTVNNLGLLYGIPGQAGRGREDVPAGTARKGEGMGPRSHVNSGHGQQLGLSLL